MNTTTYEVPPVTGRETYHSFIGRKGLMYRYEFQHDNGMKISSYYPDLESCRKHRDFIFSFPLFERYFNSNFIDVVSKNGMRDSTLWEVYLKDLKVGDQTPYLDVTTGHKWIYKRIN